VADVTPTDLVELGERYVALGLPGAARSVFERALASGDDERASAARKLAELAIASGDGASARQFAQLVVDAQRGAPARLLQGRAQSCAGELDAARFSFSAVLNAASTRTLRARAHLGRSIVATAERDDSGAAAHAMAGVDELLVLAADPAQPADAIEAELALLSELVDRAIGLGRGADVSSAVETLRQRRSEAPCDLIAAIAFAARQAHGDETVSDADVDNALDVQLASEPDSIPARLYSADRKLRRRHREPAARAEAIALLTAVAGELPEHNTLQRSRVQFLLATAYEDDPAEIARAEAAYREVLRLRPGHAAAANRLARIYLSRGDAEAALAEVERSLRIDASHGLVWRNAARVVEACSRDTTLEATVERVLDAARPGAGAGAAVVPRLLAAGAETARSDVLAGMHARGHRLKNLLGIIGSRTRSARKITPDDVAGGDLARRLNELESEVMALYEEWAAYLRSMQADGAVVEALGVAGLINEVVRAVTERSQTPIQVSMTGRLPDLRGDRMLLREALLNVVSNAAEACAGTDGVVEVRASSVASGAGRTPLIEIEVSDTGPGIARAELTKVFAPGYTTKDTGSGIGLAVAERVVSAHHGRIVLDSEVGRGTRVLMLLPTDLGGFATLAALPREPGGEGG